MRRFNLKLSSVTVFLVLALFSMPGLFFTSAAFSQATPAGIRAAPVIRLTSATISYNWAGYAATGSGVSSIAGSWTQPSVTCPSTGTYYVAIWVGIDGYSSNTVEQTGTAAQCHNGKATYWAWYEFYPKSSVAIGSIAVAPGNKFTATVTYSSATRKFTTTITDSSTGKSYSKSSAVSGAKRSSAEWIVERPEICSGGSCSLSSLADFHSATFTLASATIGGTTGSISAFTNYAITMVNSSHKTIAKPSSLGSGGSSFKVTYV
jgi:Peptidase A4 family